MLSSSTILWFLAISTLQVVGGLAVGWWLGSSRRPAAGAHHEAMTRRLTEALDRVKALAGRVGAGSVEHRKQVEAVHEGLRHATHGDVAQLHEALTSGVSQIMNANEKLQQQLNDVETKLEEQARQIETQLAEARIDSLTGVANRRAFDEEVGRRLAEWRRRHVPMSLLLVDVDHFKKINDRYGHPTGDAVLRQLARVLEHTMREMDFVARFGGEEFAIVFPGTTLRDARRAAQRALQAVAAHAFQHAGHELQVTISVGLAEVQPADDAETLIRRADEALYLSKAAGRNCGHFHSGTDFLSLDSPRLIDTPTTEAAEPAASTAPAAETVHATAAPTPVAASGAPATPAKSSRDVLTDLPGAHEFSTELRRRVQRARSEDRPLALLLVDVDHLSQINRRDGREAGDRVVQRLADVLRNTARTRDHLARYHEGQFALTLDGIGIDEAIQTAERVRRAMQAAALDAPEATISCGIAEVVPGDRSVALVMRASSALTAAKSSGRDCAFVHDGRSVEPADEIASS